MPELKIVKRCGWKDSRMLYAVYGHLFPGHDADLARGLDALQKTLVHICCSCCSDVIVTRGGP